MEKYITWRFHFLYLVLGLFLLIGCNKEEQPMVEITPPVLPPPNDSNPSTGSEEDFRIGFYNVENLFDTEDDLGNSQDDEFLPNAPKQWDEERYQRKLSNIGLVFQGMEFPAIMGLAEVENERVLEDLVNSSLLEEQGYGWVHFDSPDFRGIDVALLYKESAFTITHARAIEVVLPANVSQFSTTRDILLVQGNYGVESLNIFVNHWPSRSGGTEETAGKREFAASVLQQEIEAILALEPNANIITLGDFNDEPTNKSILEVLMAQLEKPTNTDNLLYNCTQPIDAQEIGSHWFQGNWQHLDQIMVSGQLLDQMGTLKVTDYHIFNEDFVLFDHPDDGPRPDRTYGGDVYFGGFSDHLAIFVEVEKL